jgi:hypothetical protein
MVLALASDSASADLQWEDELFRDLMFDGDRAWVQAEDDDDVDPAVTVAVAVDDYMDDADDDIPMFLQDTPRTAACWLGTAGARRVLILTNPRVPGPRKHGIAGPRTRTRV